MLNKKLSVIFTGLIMVMLLSGCAINRASVDKSPTFDPAKFKTLHVLKHARDGREINQLIANKLKQIGYSVTTGPSVPSNIDAAVTYEDRWQWDITVYMIGLTVVVREKENDFPLATAHSMHTSLTRMSPEEMVNEVITNIFGKGIVP